MARRAVAAALLTALGGCQAGSPPPATPLALSDLVTQLVRHGVAVLQTTSGDPGCSDAELAPNGVHMRLSMPPDRAVYDAFLFRFKDSTTWTAAAASVAACAAAGPTTAAAATEGHLVTFAVDPYRAFGAGWPTGLRTAFEATLRIAARGGLDPGAGQPEE